MSFAFYPITSIAICIVTVVILDGILGKVMLQIGKGTVEYDILFAIVTGVTASFIVSIIIELSNNYKENKMSWIMLREYYNVLMRTTYFLEEEQQAIDEYIARGGKLGEEDKETPMDIIEATWNQLPNIMPVIQKTVNDKKEFLMEQEIDSLDIVLFKYNCM